MTSDEIEAIKSKIDIVDVVSEYAGLKKKGKAYWACCPFHTEKTPSFCVSREKQTYYCFGCGNGGDLISFVMNAEHLTFHETLERLAERAGIRLERRGKNIPRNAQRKVEINAAALKFFRDELASHGGDAARKYLERRNLNPEECRRFEIGWAPNSWVKLTNEMLKLGYTKNELLKSGLVSEGRTRDELYDRFRGRVIFPIHNITGRLIGFGGRLIDGDGAKYLNSPESKLFSKRYNLYLLDKAKNDIYAQKSVILVEGYMDAIRAHLFGYKNTVASLGTSLTDEHALLLKRLADVCYVCYDTDSAGEAAALRAMYILQSHGVKAMRVIWKDGKDPDELLQQEGGRELFESSIKEALPLPLFHAKLKEADIQNTYTAQGAIDELLKGLASLPVFEVMPYYDELSGLLGVFPHELRAMLLSHAQHGEREKFTAENDTILNSEALECHADDIEFIFCSLLRKDEAFRKSCSLEETVKLIEDESVQNVVYALLSGEDPVTLADRWHQIGDGKSLAIIAKGDSLAAREGIESETYVKIIETLKSRYLRRRSSVLLQKIKNGTSSDNEYKEYLECVKSLKGGDVRA
ncbi:MAG: DNA primase [Synergistes sp.]|nr:DNA primase [Synergistes sp.]